MNQNELIEFFNWCNDNLLNFENQHCDESQHYYLNDVMIGGWAGDTCRYFYEQNDELAGAIRMMDASKQV